MNRPLIYFLITLMIGCAGSGGPEEEKDSDDDVSEADPAISLSSSRITENSGSNAQVGVLTVINSTEDFSYSLVSGEGDTDNALFTLLDNALLATNSLDYETTPELSIRIQATSASSSFSSSFSISIIDVSGVVITLSPSNPAVAVGSSASITASVISESGATSSAISWVAPNSDIATIVSTGNLTANITGVADGSVSINAIIDGVGTKFVVNVCTLLTNVIYVKNDAAGLSDGSSWSDAFTTLTEAINVATANTQVWVAAGTYTPGSNVTDTFQLVDDVKIYGGFKGDEGACDNSLLVRDVTESILSGDLSNNDGDGSDESLLVDNAYHVVTASGTNSTAILDGFIIKSGNADGSGDDKNGGGIYNDSGSPTFKNIIIKNNIANSDGAGVFNLDSEASFSNVSIIENKSGDDGGGIFNDGSAIAMINSIVSNNTSDDKGAGIYNKKKKPTYINVLIQGNTSQDNGAGVYNDDSKPRFTNSIIIGNKAVGKGGGIDAKGESEAIYTNCVISGNSSDEEGGGISNREISNSIIQNSIVWGNFSAISNDNIYNDSGDDLSLPTFLNSIVEGSGGSNNWVAEFGSDLGANLDANPNFIGEIDPQLAPSLDGDYQLQSDSIAIDAGLNSAELDEDYDGDSIDDSINDVLLDFNLVTRIQNEVIDIGPYERLTN